jgi:hypothetical protein
VLVLTIVVMSCFRDRKDRYLLPMVGVASVIAAQSFDATLRRRRGALPVLVHWFTLVVIACVPLLGMRTFAVKTVEGGPWFEPGFALLATISGVAIVALGALLYHRAGWRAAPVGATVALMLLLQAAGIRGYRLSREGRSEMRPLAESIRTRYPDVQMYHWRADGQMKRAPVDLSIYMNRVTKWMPDPATLPPHEGRPQVFIALEPRGEPEPVAPAGWTFFGRVKRDKDWYRAYVRAAPR